MPCLEDFCDLKAVSPDGEIDLTVRDPVAIGLPSLPGEFSCPYSLLPESRALAASLPGRVLEMPYEIADGRHGYIHVADHTFLAAWLAHPQFHMLK